MFLEKNFFTIYGSGWYMLRQQAKQKNESPSIGQVKWFS